MGRAFAATDERVLGASGAIVSDVILSMLKLDPREFHGLVVQSGEIGEALSKIWLEHCPPLAVSPANRAASVHPAPDSVTLLDLSRAFDDLASTGNFERKKAILHALYSRCVDPREAAYLSKIIFAEPRTGVREGVLHYAIAEAFARDGLAVQRAQLLV